MKKIITKIKKAIFKMAWRQTLKDQICLFELKEARNLSELQQMSAKKVLIWKYLLVGKVRYELKNLTSQETIWLNELLKEEY